MSVSSLPKETDICSIKEHLQLNSAALGTDDDSILRRHPLYGTRHGCVATGRGLSRRATIKKEVSRLGSTAQTGECGRRWQNRRRS